MAILSADIYDFESASRFLGTRPRKKLGHNTYVAKDGEEIVVEYHENPIVRYKVDEVQLDSCGWKTLTTKERMNQLIPGNFSLYQDRGIWYISDSPSWKDGQTYIFRDGVILTTSGHVIGAGDDTDAEKIRKLNKRIRKYAKDYVKAFSEGKVPAPSGGDCWFCYMTTDSGDSWGEVTQDKDHLENHMEESYFVPSLLFRAVSKYPISMFAKAVIGETWETGKYRSDDWTKLALEQMQSSIIKWLKHQFGIAA